MPTLAKYSDMAFKITLSHLVSNGQLTEIILWSEVSSSLGLVLLLLYSYWEVKDLETDSMDRIIELTHI